MIKKEELANPNSCLNKARDNELLFVLLERDEDAPETIRYWVGRRILRGKNKLTDPKIIEALECAKAMETAQRQQQGFVADMTSKGSF